MNYEQETRGAYQNSERAMAYKRHLTEDLSWARFAMWSEKCCIAKAVRLFGVPSQEKVLDVPCGTGIMASTLEEQCSGRVTALDISREMMNFAREEYSGKRFDGLIRADITEMPFREGEFAGAVVIGFMHRVPSDIRQKALQEISRVTRRFIIISYSVDSLVQKVKRFLLSKVSFRYASAPSPMSTEEIRREFERLDLKVVKRFHVCMGLSSEVIYALEKRSL